MMTKAAKIRRLGQDIGRVFHPERVILFGSRAYRTATSDSDVDLLVILSFEGRAVEKSVEIRLVLRPSFPLDLLVRTPEQVRKRLAMGDEFMRETLSKGKCSMKPVTNEWIAKGEGDFATVAFRYPGESADKKSAVEARKRCHDFRQAARRAFRLE